MNAAKQRVSASPGLVEQLGIRAAWLSWKNGMMTLRTRTRPNLVGEDGGRGVTALVRR